MPSWALWKNSQAMRLKKRRNLRQASRSSAVGTSWSTFSPRMGYSSRFMIMAGKIRVGIGHHLSLGAGNALPHDRTCLSQPLPGSCHFKIMPEGGPLQQASTPNLR